ncbi:cytochrome c oxidase subunit II [Methylorubrum extorquens]|uniref:cytochrome c oxidase subunit II n=1 Tax=Methylorubrum extorquens TaxID=408 RepID=UPI000158F32A|nr:cytochrome c oxidase subunit II [Methylorubrum extorquens]ABY28524.1 cytochrome c oxidase, subunit II [Methylorubrum extorquens PA1]KQP95405.1 cytochrome C oxidase subunit II [Methylobacterium sp. Leaf119]WIU39915.1 cytochrome c oxidase subunit II [Methylorubrum extorquens]WIU39979.1 cytochrome c oxidase subunit II [Methylorubrum extorquens]
MSARRIIPALLALPLTGCNVVQSPLNPVSPQARDLLWLFWTFTGVLAAIWLAVMLALAASLRARREAGADPLATDPQRERRTTILVTGLAVATGLVVLVLTGLSYAGQRRLFGEEEAGVTIRVLGHQWWWELQYADADPSRSFSTANEIHVPVGVPVLLNLESTDVIHSFWVPSLMGKVDLIPGRTNTLRFTAERAGIYRGQCAEFCGLQHAKMGLLVIAEEPDAFERWRAAQIRPRVQPNQDESKAGEAAFVAAPCSMCHQVRGTSAAGRNGPELTHVGSRLTLAAGTLPMSRGNLAAWIVDPHGIKPGVNMPLVKLDPGALNTISAYLEGLK